jgi:hypothetical protein
MIACVYVPHGLLLVAPKEVLMAHVLGASVANQHLIPKAQGWCWDWESTELDPSSSPCSEHQVVDVDEESSTRGHVLEVP